MGTRGLTMVICDGETKVAQYGQWDHYPEGNGITCLEFLQKGILDKFREKLKRCRFTTNEDETEIENFLKSIGSENGWVNSSQSKKYNQKYPYFSRDHGSDILNVILESDDTEILLKNSMNFASDSLFCEYAYVIDLDKNTFEVFEGFNQKPLDESERFYHLQTKDEKYYPVRLLKLYDINNLPDEETFIKDCTPPEETEEN